jgi:hypothetical protein
MNRVPRITLLVWLSFADTWNQLEHTARNRPTCQLMPATIVFLKDPEYWAFMKHNV